MKAPLVIVGGGLAGVAAALASARQGIRCVLVGEHHWLGGQLTVQAIPPDEHPWIETNGANGSYRAFRDGVRSFYRRHYPLTARANSTRRLNPGNGNIGPLSHEPFVATLVIEQQLAPWRSRGLIEDLRGWRVSEASVDADRIREISVVRADGESRSIAGDYFVDATDLGDLIEASGAEYTIGAESSATTGEPHALDGPADPTDQQACTWAIALTWSPDTDNVIAKPEHYNAWRDYTPPFWPGSLLSWTVSDHVTNSPRERPLFVRTAPQHGPPYDLWHARRVLSSANLSADWQTDNTIAAWPMMDYFRTPVITGLPGGTEAAFSGAKALSESFLFWMQTEAPRHDGGVGYPELRPLPALTGTDDGFAQAPYIREGRRISAKFTVLEQHIGVDARPGARGAERFLDSVGVGAYRIDLHPTPAGRDALDIDTWPFQIPLGSLLHERVENLLAAGKTMGTTHITNGAFRVHPSEWASGEAAGAVAAYGVANARTPEQIWRDGRILEDFQRTLVDDLDCEIAWPHFDALTPTKRFGYVPERADADPADE